MNATYRKNLKSIASACKNYTDTQVAEAKEYAEEKVSNLAWELGTYDLSVETNTDTAHIKQLPSGTIQTTVAQVDGVGYKVNQLVANGNFESSSGWTATNGTFTVSNNVATITVAEDLSITNTVQLFKYIMAKANHKYFVYCEMRASMQCTLYARFGAFNDSPSATINANVWTSICGIKEITTDGQYEVNVYSRDTAILAGTTIEATNFQIFDLTTDFGSGNEPTSVSDCYTAYLQRGINIYEYTPQQSSIKNNAFTGVKVEGANEFDYDSWYNTTTYIENGYTVRNYPVKPNTTYTLSIKELKNNSSVGIYLLQPNTSLQINGEEYIGLTSTYISQPQTFTTDNSGFIKIGYASLVDIEYLKDNMMLNRGSTAKPYANYVAPTTIPVDLTTIKDSNNVSLFPSGKMMGTNNADFITPYNQESRWNEIDLGTKSWQKETNGIFSTSIPSDAKLQQMTMICSKYEAVNTTAWDRPSGTLAYNSTFTKIIVVDTSYNDAATFKTAMSGVMLQYERATYLTSNTDLTTLTKINAESNGTITLNNTDNVDMPNTIKYLKEVAK